MCGVYGFIGRPTRKTAHIISTLGVLNSSRGKDSTGIAFIDHKDPRPALYKKPVPAYDFYGEKKIQRLIHLHLAGKDPITVLGHTRLGTTGAVTKRNAHPFNIGNVIMTHNGMVFNFIELQRKYNTTYQVDSEIIGHLLNRFQNVDNVVKKLSGVYTVPYVKTSEPDVLQVLVHSNPFNYAKRGLEFYYSSEEGHLKKALEGLKGFQYGWAGDNKHYQFYMVGGQIVSCKKKITPTAYSYGGSYGGTYKDGVYIPYDYHTGYGGFYRDSAYQSTTKSDYPTNYDEGVNKKYPDEIDLEMDNPTITRDKSGVLMYRGKPVSMLSMTESDWMEYEMANGIVESNLEELFPANYQPEDAPQPMLPAKVV